MAQAVFAGGENAYFLCILQVYRFSATKLWWFLCNRHVQWGCWWELKKRRRLGLLLMVCWERNLCICFPLLFIGEKYLTESKDSSLSRLLFFGGVFDWLVIFTWGTKLQFQLLLLWGSMPSFIFPLHMPLSFLRNQIKKLRACFTTLWATVIHITNMMENISY